MIKQGLAALLTAGAFVWLGGTALAQQTTPIQDTPVQPNQSGTTPISSSTKQFLTKTAQDSVYELASSELALQRDQNPQVAQVALHIYNDHAQFQRALLELARQYNMSLPVDLSKQDRSRLESLSRKQGTAFDQAYIQELAKANASSVSEFQRQASMVKSQDGDRPQSYRLQNTQPQDYQILALHPVPLKLVLEFSCEVKIHKVQEYHKTHNDMGNH